MDILLNIISWFVGLGFAVLMIVAFTNKEMASTKLFHSLSNGVIIGSVLFFIIAIVRKQTRPKATEALQKIARSTTQIMVLYLKWTFGIIFLTAIFSIALILRHKLFKSS